MDPRFIRWTPFELAQLRRMAANRMTSFEIASAMGGRSPSAVRLRASRLGIKLSRPSYGQVVHHHDVSQWSEADKISEWALVPQSLAELLVERALEAGLPLKQLRSDCRLPKFVTFRKAFCKEARQKHFMLSHIGRALRRDHTTVRYLVSAA
jgi:hypothetical protein